MPSCTGIWNIPHHQVRSVNIRIDPENAAGNDKVANTLLSDGHRDSCSRVRTASHVITERICCSGLRFVSSLKFGIECSLDTWNHPIPKEIN